MTTVVENRDVFLGRFVKAQGIKGEIKLYTSDDFWPEVLASGVLYVARPSDGDVIRYPVRVERSWPHQGQFILKLEGVDDRTQAEEEVGGDLFVDIENLDVPLPQRELPHQVLGMRVRTEDGRDLGRITGVVFSSAQHVYEVTGENGVVLIPAVPAFVIARDMERGEIVVRPIPGLIDG